MDPRGAPPSPPKAGSRLRLAALDCRPGRTRARALGSSHELTVRHPPREPAPVEAEIFHLEVRDAWRVGPRQWLAGRICRVRLDVGALELEPLGLVETAPRGSRRDRPGSPATEARAAPTGDPPSPSRREYELERIPAGFPAAAGAEALLHRAIDLWAGDRPRAARALVRRLLRRDLRCLAAHACLGFFAFNAAPGDGGPARARRHYAAALAIAGLSLPAGFDGLLPWSRPGNRALLRCLYGHSICLWRQGELAEARAGFLRLCRLNPDDQLAARLALDRLDRGPAGAGPPGAS